LIFWLIDWQWHAAVCGSVEAQWTASGADADPGEVVSPGAGVSAIPSGRRPDTAADPGRYHCTHIALVFPVLSVTMPRPNRWGR